MGPDRNVVQVINAIIKAIPKEQVDLRAELDGVKTSAKYTAPELMHTRWCDVARILNRYLPWPPANDWQREVADIFGAKE